MTHIIGFITSMPFLLGISVLLLIYLMQTPILTFPIYVLFVYTGMIYGFWMGIVLSYVGIFLSTNLGYYLGAIGTMDRLQNQPKMKKFNSWIENNGFKVIFFLRIIPIIPYNILSIGSGVIDIDEKKYFMFNSPSILIYAFIWSIIGHLYGRMLLNKLHFNLTYQMLVPTIIVIFAVILLYAYLRHGSNQDVPKEITNQS